MMKTRRDAVRLTSVAALAALLAACKTQGQSEKASKEPVVQDGGY